MSNIKQFWQIYRHWLLAILKEVISTPTHFITPDIKRIATLLYNGIEENGYCSNKEMAIIIRSNYSNIKNIIRLGFDSPESFLNELEQAFEQAKKF